MRKKIIVLIMFLPLLLSGCTNIKETKKTIKNVVNEVNERTSSDPFEYLELTYKEGESYISSSEDIALKSEDNKEKNYIFTYNNEQYSAVYTKDNWHITDSYKIKNKRDITLICEALIGVHPIHGADKKSYRTAEDMMYEWVQHNIAYDSLPDGNSWKSHAKDVDLNPEDQGKSLKEMYESRVNN